MGFMVGSDANLVLFWPSSCTDQPCLKQVDLCSAIHLTFDEFELGNRTFHLPVGPRFCDGSSNGGLVLRDAAPARVANIASEINVRRRSISFALRGEISVHVNSLSLPWTSAR